MTLAEKNEIEHYLKKKKLSYPLYKEILDHFIIDIQSDMDGGEGFQHAFLKAKMKWEPELRMVTPDPLSLKKIPTIEARILGSRFRKIITNSFAAALFTVLLMIIDAAAASAFSVVLGIVLAVSVLVTVAGGRLKLFDYLRLSFHPLILRVIIFTVLLAFTAPVFGDFLSSGRVDAISALQFAAGSFNLAVQIQLLHLHQKKLNVLI